MYYINVRYKEYTYQIHKLGHPYLIETKAMYVRKLLNCVSTTMRTDVTGQSKKKKKIMFNEIIALICFSFQCWQTYK